jgi:chemotaxis protein CheX
VDVKYINPFLHGVLEVLDTMAKIKMEPSKPLLKKSRRALGDVSGIMTLTGEAKGSLAASFSFDLLQHIMENMLGEYVTQVDDYVKDMVGELTNMISGVARRFFNKQGLKLVASLPMVVTGKGSPLPHGLHGPLLVIPFHSAQGDVYVEAAFKDKEYERSISAEQESRRGMRKFNRGDMSSAAGHFTKALKLDRANLEAAYGMSKIYMAAGEKSKAMELISELSKTASVLEPYHKHIFNASGIMMRELGMYDEAISMYRRALQVTKEDENLWFNLARAYYQDGKKNLARQAIHRCLRLNPEMQEAHLVNKIYLSS